MPRVIGKLTARRVATAKPTGGRTSLVIADGGNLYLQCTLGETGNVRRSWVFRFGLNGKRREMGLGPTHTIGLAEARERAKALRVKLLDNIDPLKAREQERQAKAAEEARAVTFEQCAKMYLSLHEAGWSAIHRHQWNASLRTYVYPVLGTLPVADINQAAIMKIVEPLWGSKTTTAGRVRARIEAILDYATAHRFREGDNPARIAAALPKKAKIAKVQNFAALEWRGIPQFMSELRGVEGIPARCLEFVILTGVRTNEAARATWGEIDLKTKTWVIPASRMKGRKEHKVPLSTGSIEILANLPRTGDLVFGPLSETALRKRVLRRLRPGVTVHGFRASFKTWASESTSFARDIVEVALAHKRGDAVEQAYERGTLFEKRRKLMASWADFCARPMPTGATVTKFPARAGK